MLYCHKSRVNQAGATKEQTDLELASHASEPSPVPTAVAAIGPGDKLVTDHELVRRIGHGSYGEVWLARNVIGTYRAVKIVFRAQFENEQPYEREFKGIQKFEPVSRSHEGFVDILQIGRNDQLGCFYYVMELADGDEAERSDGVVECWSNEKAKEDQLPSPPTQNPGPLSTHHSNTPTLHHSTSSYLPKTLRSELRRRGRLPVDECVSIGLTLTSALECLHKGGLVHRDIKPSNIIFVKGVPKLADVGLVADMSEAKSFVGTAGFIPPEGPGAPSADLYSLGKVFYEMSTGRDRQDFPQLPPDLREIPNHAALIELNEILLKACELDSTARYQSAEEMRADLELLKRGKSVNRRRTWSKRRQACKKVGLSASLFALAAAAGVSLWQSFNPHSSPVIPPVNEDGTTGTRNPKAAEAYRLGLPGLRRGTFEGFNLAINNFTTAIETDPAFVAAYARLFEVGLISDDYGMDWNPGTGRSQRLTEMSAKMQKLAPSDPETHAALGVMRMDEWKWREAEREFQLALQLGPNCGMALRYYGYFLNRVGRPDEARVVLQRALALDPSSPQITKFLGHCEFGRRRFQAALQLYLHASELEPSYPSAHYWAGRAYLALGQDAPALDEFEARSVKGVTDEPSIRRFYRSLRGELDKVGPRGVWLKRLEVMDTDGSGRDWPYGYAEAHAYLGNKGQALDWLEKAFVQHGGMDLLVFDDFWDSFRDEPRFKAILKKAGLDVWAR
jgi:tetratricopeptide (TPR) repeat protein